MNRRRSSVGKSFPGSGCPVLVLVQGCAFSGSTLLAFLLGSHPKIATVGEMDGRIPDEDPDQYLCSCGKRIRACEFWRSVQSSMNEKGLEFDVTRFDTKFILRGARVLQYLRYGSSRNRTFDEIRDALFYALPSERRALEAFVARNMAFMESVLEVTAKGVFVDTSKDRFRLKAVRRFSSADVRAIHLIRDVRGVVASQLRRGKSVDARDAARDWVKWNERIRTTLQSLPEECVLLLRYEDLCEDVPGTMERLYRFCGVDPSLRVTDYRAAPHHIIGNRMRLRPTLEIVPDQRWKGQLEEDQLKNICQVARGLGRRYGYC